MRERPLCAASPAQLPCSAGSCGFPLISVVPLEADRECRADIPALLLHSPAGSVGSPGGKQALLLQHHRVTVVKAPEIAVNGFRGNGEEEKEHVCHRPGLEGWPLHGCWVCQLLLPGTLEHWWAIFPSPEGNLSNFWVCHCTRQLVGRLLNLLSSHVGFHCCHSLWSRSFGNSSWFPMLRSSCASEQEEKWWHENCSVAITL